MTDEPMDMADHLIAAAKMASRQGLTKEQYAKAASTFWDTWHEIQEIMKDESTPHPSKQ